MEQGDAGDGMYVIVSGTAEVDVGGRFHKLTTGNFFGEMALVSAGKRMATVKAVEPVEAPITGGRVPGLPAGPPGCRAVDAAGGRGALARGGAADRRVDGQLTPASWVSDVRPLVGHPGRRRDLRGMRSGEKERSVGGVSETNIYKTEQGTIFRLKEDDEGRISVELLQTSLWVQGPIGMAGLRVAPTTTRLTSRQIQSLPQ